MTVSRRNEEGAAHGRPGPSRTEAFARATRINPACGVAIMSARSEHFACWRSSTAQASKAGRGSLPSRLPRMLSLNRV